MIKEKDSLFVSLMYSLSILFLVFGYKYVDNPYLNIFLTFVSILIVIFSIIKANYYKKIIKILLIIAFLIVFYLHIRDTLI